MRLDNRICAFLGGLVGSVIVAGTVAVSSPEPVAAPQEKPQEMQEMAPPKPGEMHKWLAARAGTRKISSRFRMPDGSWMSSEGVETSEMVCGGFWQMSVQRGNFMGMDFEGRMILGYDEYKKKFVGMWVDSFGSWPAMMEGHLHKDGKLLVMHSTMMDPSVGREVLTRLETHLGEGDTATFRMYMPGPDGVVDQLSMEQKIGPKQ